MTTGNFWDVTDPKKPFGDFDPNGVYDLPFDWATWLTGLTDTYASHVIVCASGLEEVSSTEDAGVITVRVQASGSPALVAGAKYGVTCRITTASGQVEDQTLYLKVREK
jgi:hypothetical protein